MTMASSPLLLGGCSLWPHLCPSCFSTAENSAAGTGSGTGNDTGTTAAGAPESPRLNAAPADEAGSGNEDLAEIQSAPPKTVQQLSDEILRDQRAKSSYFSQNFPDDIYFKGEKLRLLRQVNAKFRGVQKHIGFGNFNLIGMDEFFRYADRFTSVGRLTAEEKKFLEELFYFDATRYGFTGDKVLTKFTDALKKHEALKIPYTGHFLKKGDSLEIYNRVRKDIGESLVLTSGMRAIAKQFHLFLEKGLETGGNMSKASRSLAPPGYSFHGRGDFDVGKTGFGLKNFTDDFASTDEYKRLLDLGYINIRYTQNNTLGVRFEPWHIKVEA